MSHEFAKGQVYRSTTGELVYIHSVRPDKNVLAYEFLKSLEERLTDPMYVSPIFLRDTDSLSMWGLVHDEFNVTKWLEERKAEINA